jgi:hypothetical protein
MKKTYLLQKPSFIDLYYNDIVSLKKTIKNYVHYQKNLFSNLPTN